MSIAQNGLNGLGLATIETCRRELQPSLTELRTYIAKKLRQTAAADVIGLKAWVLPPRYFGLLFNERKFWQAWADLASVTTHKFQLVCVGDLAGGEAREGSTDWTVGKGLLGEAIFSLFEEETAFAIVHGRDWEEKLSTMSKKAFRREPRRKRRGMSQDDIKRLSKTYGTAVAVPLYVPEVPFAFGCLTAHVPYGKEWNERQVLSCGNALQRAVPSFSRQIVSYLEYRPLVSKMKPVPASFSSANP